MKESKIFVELFPGFRDYCYFKCDGQIPYYFAKIFNYQATIFTSHRDDYSALNIDIPNFKIKIIKEKKIFGKDLSQFLLILKNANKIDILYYYQIGKVQRNDFIIILLYKFLNPRGILFIRFEADLAYVNSAFPFDNFIQKEQSLFLKLLYKLYFNKVDIFGVLDFHDFRKLKDFKNLMKFLDLKKTKVQYNGFNINHILMAVNKITTFKQKDNIIITSGRLDDPIKGMDILFEALKKVNLKSWKVYLIGSDGLYLKTLYNEFILLKPELKGKIVNVGFLDDRRKYFSLLNQSKIYVLPSRLDGMPHVVAEAMAFGNVVVGSSHHGIKVALEDGQIGRLHDVGDSEKLGNILNELIDNELLLEELSEASYKKAHLEFEWGKIVQNVFKDYTI